MRTSPLLLLEEQWFYTLQNPTSEHSCKDALVEVSSVLQSTNQLPSICSALAEVSILCATIHKPNLGVASLLLLLLRYLLFYNSQTEPPSILAAAAFCWC